MASPGDLELIKATICSITSHENAREGQIKAVAQLVFEKADTVLVPATGYAKSAVLYARSALLNMITVQIMPLAKLGENQRDSIAKDVPGASPVWIDADTHLRRVANALSLCLLPLTPEIDR
jgi:superfamily II DNA helicase RecQ